MMASRLYVLMAAAMILSGCGSGCGSGGGGKAQSAPNQPVPGRPAPAVAKPTPMAPVIAPVTQACQMIRARVNLRGWMTSSSAPDPFGEK